jgi:hypothetical protein
MKPVYEGMPSLDRRFEVPKAGGGTWGTIRCGGPCKDDYARIDIYHQVPGTRFVKLQKAALDSFRSAEVAVGGGGGKIGLIFLTGSWRSCSLQAELYRSDTHRFAPPESTAHCRGLAIDVSQNQDPKKLAAIDEELLQRAWHKARPDDEPWHYSFGIEV